MEGRTYRCIGCDTTLAFADDVIDRKSLYTGFLYRQGKAYFFSNVVNVTLGPEEELLTMTSMYTVQDIFCVGCGQNLGYKYVIAHDEFQMYKEGKFVLERGKIEEDVVEGGIQSRRSPRLK